MIFCISETKVCGMQASEGWPWVGAREDFSIIAVVNLEGAFTGGGVYTVIVSECHEG